MIPKMRTTRIRTRLALLGLVLATVPALGADDTADEVKEKALPFSDGGWELSAEGARTVKVGDREVLSVETGGAVRRDVRLEDGTIDFEVQVTDRRSFVFLHFRMVSDDEHEEIYLRPHKSNLPDALQYAPVWQGRSSWQLYHGPGGTAAVDLPAGEWIPVRVVLQGRRAAIFVGDLDEPAMVVPRLARKPAAGYLALRAFLPGGVPPGPVARYSNVRIRPGFVPFDFSTADTRIADPGPGVVRAWAVSRAYVPDEGPASEIPDRETVGGLRRIEAEPSGLVPLLRDVPWPEGSRRAATLARVKVRAETAGLRRLELGFSDEVTVFLNGRPLFYGDDSYSFDNPRRQGVIYFGQATLLLPLEAGENELAIVVGDRFGGWGLMARFADAAGLTVEAR
jgi:hypothetical protein